MKIRCVAVAAGATIASAALGQCSLVVTERGEPAGLNGDVYASTIWDSDGEGANAPMAVIGGDFTRAGLMTVSGLVGWNGQNWVVIAPGVTNVRDVIAWGSKLVVRGTVTGITTPLAAWDGSSWAPVGTTADVIVDLCTDSEGALIAAGTLPTGSGDAQVASWTGSQWLSLGTFPTEPVLHINEFNGTLIRMQPLPRTGGEGFCSMSANTRYRISRFVGGDWSTFGYYECTRGSPLASTMHNNELWVVGRRFDAGFNLIGDIADGSSFLMNWTALAMASFQGRVYVAGLMTGSNTPWWATGASSNFQASDIVVDRIRALTAFNDQLLIGGEFFRSDFYTPFSSSAAPLRIGKIVDNKVRPLRGTDGAPRFFSPVLGQMWSGGDFSSLNAGSARVVSFGGSDWSPVAYRSATTMYAACEYNGEGYVATNLLGTGPSEVCRVTGGQLVAVAGVPNVAYRDLVMNSGKLYAVGARVVELTGSTVTGNWPMGAVCNAAAVYGGDVVVVGAFTTANGVPAQGVARLSGGTWSAMGAGLFGTVNDVIVHRGELIAGGTFSLTNGGTTISLAKWNGASWEAMATANGTVISLASRRGDLLVGGGFTTIGGVPAGRLAALDGSGWRTLVTGIDGEVRAVGAMGEDVFVGGVFSNVAGSAAPFYVRLTTAPGCCGSSDYDGDGDFGTDADIEAFFACLGGNCCSLCTGSDFDGDGDFGTDSDIEAFFRVLGGGTC